MKTTTLTILSAILLLGALGNTPAGSEEPNKVDREKVMKIISPGPMHKLLEYEIGTWDVEARLTMPGMPERKPDKLVAKVTWLMEGRWAAEDMEGTLMGRPFKSHTVAGYDNMTKNFVTTSVSNMDTSMITLRGVAVDPNHQVFTLYGTLNEYLDGTFNKPIRVVTKRIDQDHFVREIWDLQIGQDGAAVQTFHFTRRK